MRLVLGLILSLCLAGAAAGQERAVDPDTFRGLAIEAVDSGRFGMALSMTDALLERDPADVDALLVRSHAARQLGRLDVARDAAGRAWRAAESDEKRYAAALAQAQALSSSGNRTMAQLWLRRAGQVAPTEMHRALAAQDFRYVQSRNPLRVDLSFSVAPVSNVNNGAKEARGTYELPFFGVIEAELSGAALALSGIETQTGVALRYRLHDRGKAGATDLHLIASRRDYSLSDEARDRAPGVEGSDFAFASTQVVLAQSGRAGSERRPFQVSGALGRTWYGGAAYTQFADLSGSLSFALEDRRAVVLRAGLRRDEALDPRTADAESWRLGAGWRQGLGKTGSVLSFDLEARQSRSDYAALDWRAMHADARVQLGKPVLGMGLEFGLSAGMKQFERGPMRGLGREDRSLGAEITAEIRQVELYGFVPRVTLDARRTDSDFSQYDTEEIGLRLGFRSSF